jgi:hypothetical protein
MIAENRMVVPGTPATGYVVPRQDLDAPLPLTGRDSFEMEADVGETVTRLNFANVDVKTLPTPRRLTYERNEDEKDEK